MSEKYYLLFEEKVSLSCIIQTSICLSQVEHQNRSNIEITLEPFSFAVRAIMRKLLTIEMHKLEEKKAKTYASISILE